MRLPILNIAVATTATLILSSCGSPSEAGESEPSETRLESAYSVCAEPAPRPATLEEQKKGKALDIADAGKTLIVQTEGEYDTMGYLDYMCVVGELGTSERVQSSIGSTTSMMGRQSAEEDGLSYEYTYHPDNGLNVLIGEQ